MIKSSHKNEPLDGGNYALASTLRAALKSYTPIVNEEPHSNRGNEANYDDLVLYSEDQDQDNKYNTKDVEKFISFIERDYDIIGELERKFTDIIPRGKLDLAKVQNSSDRLRTFLARKSVDKKLATEVVGLFSEFVAEEFPELETLSAVQDLREQYLAEQPVVQKRKYPGRRSSSPDADPVKFLNDVYGDDVEAGRLSVSRLQEIDSALYQSLYTDMRAQGKTVSDILNPKSRDYLRRAAACAHILGIPSPEEAGRFFGMRPERIASRLERS